MTQENYTTNAFELIDQNEGGVTEVTEETFFEALGTVPPVYGKYCFGMGEIARHTRDGKPEYYCFASMTNGKQPGKVRCYGFLGTIDAADKVFATIKGYNAELS